MYQPPWRLASHPPLPSCPIISFLLTAVIADNFLPRDVEPEMGISLGSQRIYEYASFSSWQHLLFCAQQHFQVLTKVFGFELK